MSTNLDGLRTRCFALRETKSLKGIPWQKYGLERDSKANERDENFSFDLEVNRAQIHLDEELVLYQLFTSLNGLVGETGRDMRLKADRKALREDVDLYYQMMLEDRPEIVDKFLYEEFLAELFTRADHLFARFEAAEEAEDESAVLLVFRSHRHSPQSRVQNVVARCG